MVGNLLSVDGESDLKSYNRFSRVSVLVRMFSVIKALVL